MFTDHFQPGWRDCYTAWLTHVFQRSGSDATVANYASIIRRFFEACGKSPEMVTRSDVELFASKPLVQRDRGRAPAAHTRNGRIMAISSFYSYAGGYEYMDGKGALVTLTDRNPAKGIRQSRTQARYRSMTMDEFQRFIAAIPQDGDKRHARDRAIFLTLWWTCRRREEVASLLWGNIRKNAFVDPKTQQSREGWTYTTRIKGGEVVSAELPSPAMDAILESLRISGRIETMEPDSPLFLAYPAHEWPPVAADRWHHISGLSIWRRMRVYLHTAGLDETAFSVHCLRHAGALARYLYADSGPLEIMKLLNHHDLKVTTIYLRELNMSHDLAALRLQEKYGAF